MGKFLYPIYKLEDLELYKKWWLYNKKVNKRRLSDILYGYSFTLENSRNKKFKIFNIQGNSIQNGEPTPTNPIDISSCGDDVNEFDKDNADVLNVNLSSSSVISEDSPSNRTLYIPVQPNTTYTIQKAIGSVFTIGTTESTPAKNLAYSQRQSNATTKSLTITTNATAQYLVCWFWSTQDTLTVQEMLDSIKICKSTVATPYSPYGMGSISEKIQNKNLVAKNIKGYINNNNNFVIDNNSESFVFWAEKGKTYIRSCLKTINRSIIGKAESLNITNNTPVLNVINNAGNSFTSEFTGYCVWYVNSTLNDEIKDSFIVELGSTASPYVAHQEQNPVIYTQQPMRSIGEVRDDFVKIGKDWFERHKTEKVVLDGTENWSNGASSGWYRYYYNLENSINLSSRQLLLSNYFHFLSSGNEVGICFISSQNLFLYPEQTITTTSDFKTWLSTHNTEVIYQLATPTLLPCTQEQIDVLENIYSYSGQTNISSEDVVKAYLEIQYYMEG